MTRDRKISDIITVLKAIESGGVDMYVDVYDLDGAPYYGIGLGQGHRTGEYGVFTGDFMFVPLKELDDDSIDLIYDQLS